MAEGLQRLEGDLPVAELIDREAPTPVHVQLRESLRVAIERLDWPPGSPLPSEAEIAQHYGVSLSTDDT